MVFAIVTNGAVLVGITAVICPISREIVAVQDGPVTLAKQVGFIIEDPREPRGPTNAPSWNPYYWAAIHVVRRNDALLANAPWMDETILPVGPGPDLPEERIPVLQTPVPNHLYRELLAVPEQRMRAMNAVSFIVVQQHDRPAPEAGGDPMEQLETGLQGSWTCRDGAVEWYRLCRRQ